MLQRSNISLNYVELLSNMKACFCILCIIVIYKYIFGFFLSWFYIEWDWKPIFLNPTISMSQMQASEKALTTVTVGTRKCTRLKTQKRGSCQQPVLLSEITSWDSGRQGRVRTYSTRRTRCGRCCHHAAPRVSGRTESERRGQCYKHAVTGRLV